MAQDKKKNIEITDDIRAELNRTQEKLLKEENSQYIKPKLPKGVKLTKRELTTDLCIALIWIYRFYRHNENAEVGQYYSKQQFFEDLLDKKEYNNITKNYHRLKWWGLIEPMPTDPNVIKYKKGWYGITENGIAFVQREIGMPKYALVYNDFPYEHITNKDYVMIDKALEKIEVDYNEILTQ
tara:strand:+ start:4458 stop:5003 length:546 start_codon:yes stop_codon:yes gene_type:complete